MIDIDKSFEGRWRIRSQRIKEAVELMLIEYRVDYVKKICRDFFEAGVLIGEGFVSGELINADGTPTGIEVTVKHDPILDTEDEGFEHWWQLYDKRCGKKDCLKKWKKLTFEEKLACIQVTPAYVASTPDKSYRKNPLTYLNQKAWNDEIINRNGTNKQQQQADRLAKVAERIAEYTKDT